MTTLSPALSGVVQAVVFSPRGDLLAVARSAAAVQPAGNATTGGGVELWRTRDWQLQETLAVAPTAPGGSPCGVSSISFSPDGSRLARCRAGAGEIEIIQVTTKERQIVPGEAKFGSFSPDGNHIAVLLEAVFSILVAPER